MFGLKQDWVIESPERCMLLEDYAGAEPRWCPGCGDHAILNAVLRICRDEQLAPEKTVIVSGIGCSSRFPHYVKTYGFHGLHGRALPVACGVRSRRPDLNVFVITGDGDCCAIGTGHWIHTIRYNMKLPILMFDNNIYGLTKKQSSPTSPPEVTSNTHPFGVPLQPLNPISVTLGIANASFVAQTVDWNPAHLYATIYEAWKHPGTAFVRIMQRCPHFMPNAFKGFQDDPTRVLVMKHPDGIPVDDAVGRLFKNQVAHDPSNLAAARELAETEGAIPIGLFYRNLDAARYDTASSAGVGMSVETKMKAVNAMFDRMSTE